MNLILTPPVFSKKGYGITFLKSKYMDEKEGLMLTTNDWSVIDFLRFWHSEFVCLTTRRRSKCIINSGFYREDGILIPYGFFAFYRVKNKILIRSFASTQIYNDLHNISSSSWENCYDWWKNIPPYRYKKKVVEYRAGEEEILEWCEFVEGVISYTALYDNDDEFPIAQTFDNHFKRVV
ncbi:MAG: hypothetical protein ACI4P6_08485 [Candidatus Spyradosoma sp.]